MANLLAKKTLGNKNSKKSFVVGFVIIAIVIIVVLFFAIIIAKKQQGQNIKRKDIQLGSNYEPICSRPIPDNNYIDFYQKNTTISPDLKKCIFKTPDSKDIFNVTFSPNSKRLAYTVREDNDKNFVVLDDKKSDKYETTVSSDFTFSPDSKHFVYTINRNRERFIVLDNKEYKIENCDNIWSLTFSPDGEKFAYAVAVKGDDIAVLNGIKGKGYTRIESLAFSPNGKHFMYKVEDKRFKDKGVFIVLDNQERSEMFDFPVFSLDEKHIAYATEKNDKQFVVLDGRKNKLYEEVSNLTFSSNGKHFAYVAKEDNEYFIVLDNKEGEKYSKHLAPKSYLGYSSIDNLKFSSDNKFFAYTVNNGRYMRYINKDDHFVLLRNLKSGKEKKYTGGCSFLFSPNSKYFLYKSYVGDGDDFGEKRNCNIITLNDNNDEFEMVKSYVTKKFTVNDGKYIGERILNFNFKFSDDSKYVIYNKEKIVLDESFDIYYVEEPIE